MRVYKDTTDILFWNKWEAVSFNPGKKRLNVKRFAKRKERKREKEMRKLLP